MGCRVPAQCPFPTHLHVALAVGAGDWGGKALHTQLGQQPHSLGQDRHCCITIGTDREGESLQELQLLQQQPQGHKTQLVIR